MVCFPTARITSDINYMLDEIEKDTLMRPDIIYITGDSGSGKTYQAYKFALNMYTEGVLPSVHCFLTQFLSYCMEVAS